MKYIFIMSLLFLIVLSGCQKNPESDLSKSDKTVYAVIRQFSDYARKQYGLSLCGLGGGSTNGKSDLINISFNFYRPIFKEQGRELIINVLDEFIQMINQNESIYPYLSKIPFNQENINLIIFCRNIDNYKAYDPYLAVVSSSSDGKIIYATNDPENPYDYKTWEEETYEEAVAILTKEQSM